MGLSHCRHGGLVKMRDETRLRQGHNDQSCQGQQCSKTTLTGESWFHISTRLGIEPWSLMTGSKGLSHGLCVNAVRLQAFHIIYVLGYVHSILCLSRLCPSRLCLSRICRSRLCLSRFCPSRLCLSRICRSTVGPVRVGLSHLPVVLPK